jgi:hypothetical protein
MRANRAGTKTTTRETSHKLSKLLRKPLYQSPISLGVQPGIEWDRLATADDRHPHSDLVDLAVFEIKVDVFRGEDSGLDLIR